MSVQAWKNSWTVKENRIAGAAMMACFMKSSENIVTYTNLTPLCGNVSTNSLKSGKTRTRPLRTDTVIETKLPEISCKCRAS
jgi:hypothetical protein